MSQASSLARRLRRPLLVLGLVACLTGGAAWLLWPADAIGPRALHRIRLGMSEAEVEAAIGLPPEEESSERLTLHACGLQSIVASVGDPIGDQEATKFWCGNEFWITAKFNDAGTAIGITLWEAPSDERPGFLDRLRVRLGL